MKLSMKFSMKLSMKLLIKLLMKELLMIKLLKKLLKKLSLVFSKTWFQEDLIILSLQVIWMSEFNIITWFMMLSFWFNFWICFRCFFADWTSFVYAELVDEEDNESVNADEAFFVELRCLKTCSAKSSESAVTKLFNHQFNSMSFCLLNFSWVLFSVFWFCFSMISRFRILASIKWSLKRVTRSCWWWAAKSKSLLILWRRTDVA